MIKEFKLGASILNAKDRLKTIEKLITKNIKWIHYDLMEQNFVSNHQMPVKEIDYLINNSKDHIKDIHIMSSNVIEIIENLNNNYDYSTFHYEAVNSVETIFNSFPNKKLGIAINLETDVEVVIPYLKNLSNILIMSVKPGQGGQLFNTEAIEKVRKLRTILVKNNANHILIGVDGGINDKNYDSLLKAGADYLIMGSWLINNLDNDQYLKIFNKNAK